MPTERQTLLFSATMPPKIRQLGLSILKDPAQINISISKPPEKITQLAYIIFEAQKTPIIQSILKDVKFKKIVVFCSRKENVKKLSRELNRSGIKNEEIHSDLEQQMREQVLLNFRSGKTAIIIATDVISRGLDIEDIDLVINYDVPNDGEDYVHRIGRTARAATDGTAITLVSEPEQYKLFLIEELLAYPIPKAAVDTQFGETPLYQPQPKKKLKKPNKRRHFRKKGPQQQ